MDGLVCFLVCMASDFIRSSLKFAAVTPGVFFPYYFTICFSKSLYLGNIFVTIKLPNKS